MNLAELTPTASVASEAILKQLIHAATHDYPAGDIESLVRAYHLIRQSSR